MSKKIRPAELSNIEFAAWLLANNCLEEMVSSGKLQPRMLGTCMRQAKEKFGIDWSITDTDIEVIFTRRQRCGQRQMVRHEEFCQIVAEQTGKCFACTARNIALIQQELTRPPKRGRVVELDSAYQRRIDGSPTAI